MPNVHRASRPQRISPSLFGTIPYPQLTLKLGLAIITLGCPLKSLPVLWYRLSSGLKSVFHRPKGQDL